MGNVQGLSDSNYQQYVSPHASETSDQLELCNPFASFRCPCINCLVQQHQLGMAASDSVVQPLSMQRAGDNTIQHVSGVLCLHLAVLEHEVSTVSRAAVREVFSVCMMLTAHFRSTTAGSSKLGAVVPRAHNCWCKQTCESNS